MSQSPHEEEDKPSSPTLRTYPNVALKTLGGSQFWTDHCWRNGWRLQQNVLTRHWRLLNPRNVRLAWGSRPACESVLAARQPECSLPNDRVVFLLHGLMRSWRSMRPLGNFLTGRLPAVVAYFEYASSRVSIAAHARALIEVLEALPINTRIDFVCHSMGNIVVRHMLGQLKSAEQEQLSSRIEHMVMLGPPNQGSSIARLLAPTGVFGLLTGPGGRELGVGWNEFCHQLSIPQCPFGVVAGRLPKSFNNPLVTGDGDFVVSVAETKLEGASDYLEVPHIHSFLMAAPEVHQAVLHFLQEGSFGTTENN